jgi:hypothetical protein
MNSKEPKTTVEEFRVMFFKLPREEMANCLFIMINMCEYWYKQLDMKLLKIKHSIVDLGYSGEKIRSKYQFEGLKL